MKRSDGYISYIINPKSGTGSGKVLGEQFVEYLKGKGFEVRVDFTDSLEHACEIATDAAVDYDCAMVVAAGGDGTIREAAHGLEGSDKPLLIVPCGTENLLANELGFDRRLDTIIKTFEAGFTMSLDLGSINGRCFTSVAGFGFDGEVVKYVSEKRQGCISHFAYVEPIWRTFWGHKFPQMKVTVDGAEIFDGQGMVFVGNISRYAVGLEILHTADFSDSLLDVCVYKCSSRLRLVKHSVMTVIKRHTFCKDVIYKQGKKVTISCGGEDVATEIDGDPGPGLPVEINIIAQAVKVFKPEGIKPVGIRRRIIRALR